MRRSLLLPLLPLMGFVVLIGDAACGGGCGGSSKAVPAPASAPEPGEVAAPTPAVEPAAPATPEAQAEEAVKGYVRAVMRGDLRAMRERMGGEMAAQFDRVIKERGEEAMRQQVKRGLPLRTLGPGRPSGDGAWTVSCRLPPAPQAGPGGAQGKPSPTRVDFDVRRQGDAFLLVRLTTLEQAGATR